MFTGIIEEIGKIISIKEKRDLTQISINTQNILKSAKIGDSISINGTCLTITSIKDLFFTSDIVKETIQKTNLKYRKIDDYVNLERSMRADSRFDGHIVQGHVEGVAVIQSIKKDKDSIILKVKLPEELAMYCIHKGSIAINGVSLTIASIEENYIDIWIIPHTLKHTTFGKINNRDYVNVETDIIAKYIQNFQNGYNKIS